MSDQNWRPELDAGDYFSNQKKKAELADRRPVIRRAGDLVGPGLNMMATPISDFNDPLAQYNGFFSALSGAANAPTSGNFTGVVVSDATQGGTQTFTRADGEVFVRTFSRAPEDASHITWGIWRDSSENHVRTGMISYHGSMTPPSGWYLCDGSEKNRTADAALFDVIGTSFGAGDGFTTFNLPNPANRFIIGPGLFSIGGVGGSATVAILEENLPAHTHSIDHTHTIRTRTNGAAGSNTNRVAAAQGATDPDDANTAVNTFTGSSGATGAGTPINIVPPLLAIPLIIKR